VIQSRAPRIDPVLVKHQKSQIKIGLAFTEKNLTFHHCSTILASLAANEGGALNCCYTFNI